MHYFLAIDAGGSHCRARLADAGGRVVGTGLSGPANARIGVAPLYATLSAAADAAIAAAGLDAEAVATVRAGMGIAGIQRPGVRDALAAMPFPYAALTFATDAEIALLGAFGGADGAVLILGTGSIAQIRCAGRSFSIGGYGFPISDEGSGAALGLSAMRHALRALDGRTRMTPFGRAVAERFGQDTARAVAWMDGATPGDYATFAPLVMDHADRGDPIARSIVEDAALHVERFVEAVFAAGAPRCALMGGLAPRMRPWLRARTVEGLSAPQGDALDGALRLAGLVAPPQSGAA